MSTFIASVVIFIFSQFQNIGVMEKRLQLVSNSIKNFKYILQQQNIGGEEKTLEEKSVVVPINNPITRLMVYAQFKIIHGKYDSWRL